MQVLGVKLQRLAHDFAGLHGANVGTREERGRFDLQFEQALRRRARSFDAVSASGIAPVPEGSPGPRGQLPHRGA